MPVCRPDPSPQLPVFLAEGLCGIQKKLGEDHLSMMCSAYPRVMNVVDDVLQRSLDLSCPEAARIVLLDPNPMQFDEEEGPVHDTRLAHLSILSTADRKSGKPYQYFRDIRAFVIWLLQYRAFPLWKRLVILGSLCDQLHDMSSTGRNKEAPRSFWRIPRRRRTRSVRTRPRQPTVPSRPRNWNWCWS